jgi:hypothetical protein
MTSLLVDTIRSSRAFVELLSLGVATIGLRATLSDIGGQLLEDASSGSRQRRRVVHT